MNDEKKEPNYLEKVFEEDEMELRGVNSRWTPDELLAQEGIFFLKDIVSHLELDPVKVKKRAREIEKQGQIPWKVMGARKIWNHWIVRMTVFGPYYRKHLERRLRRVDENWDGNTLLEQKGVFALTEVCRVIPFSTHQLRYQAKRNPNAKNDIGIWKDTDLNIFLVEMERFGPYVKSLWGGAWNAR